MLGHVAHCMQRWKSVGMADEQWRCAVCAEYRMEGIRVQYMAREMITKRATPTCAIAEEVLDLLGEMTQHKIKMAYALFHKYFDDVLQKGAIYQRE